ncbi:MAG TPA: prepilin peptidase [Acidimicrobiales bacterium]|nr:prepilin peptidase [Acidimicrobiales bacterium]
MLAPLVVLCGVVGLMVGSFLNVVIHRLPRDESVVTPRSHCPNCDTELANRDNIPVLSWLVLRGRCRTCGNPISARYPLVEGLTGALFATVTARFGWDEALPAYLVLTAFLIALSAIDLDTFLLPKKLVWPAFGAGVVLLGGASALQGDARSALEAAAGSTLAFGALFAIHFVSPKGMGFGDVRLAAVLGLYLGWLELPEVPLGLFLSFLVASVVGVGLIVTKRKGRKDRVPFGPFLAVGTGIAVLFGEWILGAYLGR